MYTEIVTIYNKLELSHKCHTEARCVTCMDKAIKIYAQRKARIAADCVLMNYLSIGKRFALAAAANQYCTTFDKICGVYFNEL